MDDSTNTSTRVIDLDEVERLIAPHTYNPRLTLERGRAFHSRPGARDRLLVSATLLGLSYPGAVDFAAIRLASVRAGNEAIEALEAAGYEHAAPPKIEIGGIETPEITSEAMPYIVDATLTMTLLGKRARA